MEKTTSLKIGSLCLESNLVMAPLAELSHAPFRQLVAELGGCGLFYSEMLNARIVSGAPIAADPYVAVAADDRPLIGQLVGNEPGRISQAIKKLEDFGYNGFDINMGCAMRKIRKRGWGVGLMADPKQAMEVVVAARAATKLPLIAKLRSGATHDTAKLITFVKQLVDCGLDAVVLHPRSVKDGFKRPAQWAEIKSLVAAVGIPVIGNGDIMSALDAEKMFAQTNCAGVMIGRGALIRPWIFWEISHGKPWPGSVIDLFSRLRELVQQYSPPELWGKRYHFNSSWLLRNYLFYHNIISKIKRSADIDEMHAIITDELGGEERPLLQRPFAGKL